MLAITRKISPRLADCELAYLTREPIDLDLAARQHRDYEQCLESLGARVMSLPAEPDLPDSVFVEDPAVVLDELAVICRMGALSRRPESEQLAGALAQFRELRRMQEPATLEGGDVFRSARTIYAGLSGRSNRAGVESLAQFTAGFGYRVVPVEVKGCLHLKTACCPLDDETVLAARPLIDASALAGLRIIDVPAEEPWGADVLTLGGAIVCSTAFPRTAELLDRLGYRVRPVNVSELHKAESGVTCMSLLLS